MANRDGLVGERLPKIASDAVLQFIGDAGILEVRGGVARRSTLEGDD